MANPKNDGITAEELRAAMSYDPETGVFSKSTASGGRKILGCVKRDGYVKIFAGGKQRSAHRLAWLYVFGKWPDGVIDHINGNRMDNRITNLRDVAQSENSKNRCAVSIKKQSSRHIGVYFYKNKSNKPWTAQIVVNGKNNYLGCFATEAEAAKAYSDAKNAANNQDVSVEPQ